MKRALRATALVACALAMIGAGGRAPALDAVHVTSVFMDHVYGFDYIEPDPGHSTRAVIYEISTGTKRRFPGAHIDDATLRRAHAGANGLTVADEYGVRTITTDGPVRILEAFAPHQTGDCPTERRVFGDSSDGTVFVLAQAVPYPAGCRPVFAELGAYAIGIAGIRNHLSIPDRYRSQLMTASIDGLVATPEYMAFTVKNARRGAAVVVFDPDIGRIKRIVRAPRNGRYRLRASLSTAGVLLVARSKLGRRAHQSTDLLMFRPPRSRGRLIARVAGRNATFLCGAKAFVVHRWTDWSEYRQLSVFDSRGRRTGGMTVTNADLTVVPEIHCDEATAVAWIGAVDASESFGSTGGPAPGNYLFDVRLGRPR